MGICARSARHTNLRVSMSVPLSILYLLIINLMEFLKVWAKHSFYYIQYISVYIQPRYFYLIFRSVNGNNMNRVILHSMRPSFWKRRDFSHAPRCGSTESGCEISVPWWLILADQGRMTSVWSRDRDTGDTSEPIIEIDNSRILEIAKSPKITNSRKCRHAKFTRSTVYIWTYWTTFHSEHPLTL